MKADTKKVSCSFIYTGVFGGFGGVYNFFNFRIIADADNVCSLMYLPASAIERRREMAEFITRVNYTLMRGKFEMDYDDGEVRFQYAQPASSILGDRTDDSLATVFLLPPGMMRRYAPGMAEILIGGSGSVEEIVKKCRDRHF